MKAKFVMGNPLFPACKISGDCDTKAHTINLKASIDACLNTHINSFRDDPTCSVAKEPSTDQPSRDDKAIEYTFAPTFAASDVKVPQRYSGLMYLRCEACGDEFVTFHRESVSTHQCRCGATIKLESMVRFDYTCPCCGKATYGLTNVQSGSIKHQCRCGNESIMTYVSKKGMFCL